MKGLVVGIDGSPSARAALRWELVDEVDTTGIPQVDRVLTMGDAAGTLLTASKDADLLVVGSRGLGGFAGLLLGSVTHHLAHHAICPLVIIPPRA